MNQKHYFLLSLFSLGLVVVALALQHIGYQEVSFLPCPLCILQRIGYIGIAIFSLLAVGMTPLKKLFHFLALICALYGVFVAGRHVWLLSHPENSCGIDPLETWINQFQLVKSLPWLFKADGLCSAKLPAILGLQVPQWSLLWFGVISAVLLITMFRKTQQ
jgi:protein dithiol:quinone oxidoreductase